MQFLSLGYCWNLLPIYGRENDQVRSRQNKTADKCISTVVKNAQSSPNVSNDVNEIQISKKNKNNNNNNNNKFEPNQDEIDHLVDKTV